MSLLTRCTHCHTVFRITAEQLQAHGGKVRCGRCLQIFDGMVALAPDAPEVQTPEIPQPVAAGPAVAAAVAGAAAEIPSSSALAEAPAGVVQPEALSLDMTPEVTVEAGAPLDMRPQAPAEASEPNLATELEAERVATVAENPFIQEPEMTEPVPQRPWLAAAGIVLSVVLAGQAVFFYRGELAARHPLARQWLNAACLRTGCTVPLPRETKAVLIEASDLQLVDPARPDRILLTATLRNHAGHDVAYPALDLVLTNATDHTLARRIFLPVDYLGKNRDPHAGLTANAELTVRLTLDTGSLGAAGFRLALLPAPRS